MRQLALSVALCALAAMPGPAAAAECYADYKAKQDAPLRLHYGVARIEGPCQKGAAANELDRRLSAQGWKLLNVLSVFGPDGLDQRRENAGTYFLRY